MLMHEHCPAGQSVLEGLNAVLDHRAEVYIPELGQTFQCHPAFRLFGAQNPLEEGGGRRGLPRSFLNRFTRVAISLLTPEDLTLIAGAFWGMLCTSAWLHYGRALWLTLAPVQCKLVAEMAASCGVWHAKVCGSRQVQHRPLLQTQYRLYSEGLRLMAGCHAGALHSSMAAPLLQAMVGTMHDLHQGCNVTHTFGAVGAPWEFNLRDLLRWCQLAAHLAASEPNAR